MNTFIFNQYYNNQATGDNDGKTTKIRQFLASALARGSPKSFKLILLGQRINPLTIHQIVEIFQSAASMAKTLITSTDHRMC